MRDVPEPQNYCHEVVDGHKVEESPRTTLAGCQGTGGSSGGSRVGGRGLESCTHLWVEWEFDVGFFPEAELGDVIQDRQEVIV